LSIAVAVRYPSKLAVTVVNTNGGKTEALNGYDYLFVRSSTGVVPP